MTEDQVILSAIDWLKNDGWKIDHHCLGNERGIDILASKDGRVLIVEAKGAKGNLSTTTRDRFDSGQIKTHFGVAIIKVLEEKTRHPDAEIAIAQPDDERIRRVLKDVIQHMKVLKVKLFWVRVNGVVSVE